MPSPKEEYPKTKSLFNRIVKYSGTEGDNRFSRLFTRVESKGSKYMIFKSSQKPLLFFIKLKVAVLPEVNMI